MKGELQGLLLLTLKKRLLIMRL